ncbi:MAG: hypothetical protein FRX49_04392 [Trebouxia sp. A1-2]|nr:MAG: hypothetical protein FRX49_04392 [Trebouxia sp. A1-2]
MGQDLARSRCSTQLWLKNQTQAGQADLELSVSDVSLAKAERPEPLPGHFCQDGARLGSAGVRLEAGWGQDLSGDGSKLGSMQALTFLGARTLFRKILVSSPANSTRPMTQSVLRRVQPLSNSASSAPFIGLLTFHPRASSKGPSVHSTGHNLGASVAVFQLEVGFAIQVCGLHIAQECNEQEVHVGHSGELLEQVDWQETEHCIFGCPDVVARQPQGIQQSQLGAKEPK